jgi:4'-phosphopantetheinyl transferase
MSQLIAGHNTILRRLQEASDDISPERALHSTIGYHLSNERSIIGMAMSQGRQKQVTTIGLSTKQLLIDPPGTPFSKFIESQGHKVRRIHNDPD